MACGLPVVSTTLAGVPEMVLHNETGLLAPPGDAPALAAHLTTLARDAALRARLGTAGLQRVQQIFSLTKTAGHLATLFPPASQPPCQTPGTLCLLDAPQPPDAALLRELLFLSTQPNITLLATRQTAPDGLLEYLPDATVLEAAWHSRPDLAALTESLRAEAGPVDGEHYYLTARRAVHLAPQASRRGWKKLHALRANTVLLTWLLHRLTNLPASATIEATHPESRAVLTKLLPAFTHGSNSDPKLKSPFTDLLKLAAAPAKKRILGISLTPVPVPPSDPAPVWRDWLLPIRFQDEVNLR